MRIEWSEWAQAARLDAWDERDVIYLCTGKRPAPNNGSTHRRKRNQSESVQELERRQEQERVQAYISMALEVGALKAISQTPFPDPGIDPYTGQPIEDDRILFDPAAFTAWARKKFPDTFPEKVVELLDRSSSALSGACGASRRIVAMRALIEPQGPATRLGSHGEGLELGGSHQNHPLKHEARTD